MLNDERINARLYIRFEQTFMRSSKLKRVKVKELI